MRLQCEKCSGLNAIDEADLGQLVECGHCLEPLQVPEERFAPGVVVKDDFIIEKKIGQGGMGMVFRAYQMSLDRQVALKILMLDRVKEEGVIDFIREARASSRLTHHNIVSAYAVGESEGVYYLAMELVNGQTLKEIMDETGTQISVEDSVDIMIQVVEALAYAWDNQKLVHRDIKPDNIMLMDDNRTAKLMDMGLSSFANDNLETQDESDEIMGTPQYIAPEQLMGEDMDFRCDQYSLGATFYHLITAQFPFNGPNVAEIARMHLQEPLQSPKTHDASIPESVCSIIYRMMGKKPEDRYQSMHDLLKQLQKAKIGFTQHDTKKTTTTNVGFKLKVRKKRGESSDEGGLHAKRPVRKGEAKSHQRDQRRGTETGGMGKRGTHSRSTSHRHAANVSQFKTEANKGLLSAVMFVLVATAAMAVMALNSGG